MGRMFAFSINIILQIFQKDNTHERYLVYCPIQPKITHFKRQKLEENLETVKHLNICNTQSMILYNYYLASLE